MVNNRELAEEKYIVSACLLGENCKYDGDNNYSKEVIEFLQDKDYVAACPEVLGGLPTPRTPAERVGDKVISRDGEDFTENFIKGAEETLKIAKENSAKIAILKARSPSCGYGCIYDGSFSKKLVEGNGVTSELLEKNGIKVITELDLK